MLRIEMGITGMSRKDAAGIIGNYYQTKPVYKGGTNFKYSIKDWEVFLDTEIEPQKAEEIVGDDYKVGICIPKSNQEEISGILGFLKEAGAILNQSCRLTVAIKESGHTIKSKENLTKLFESKKELIVKALGIGDGNIEFSEEKVIFRLFRATLDAERILAYEQFCTLLNQMAINSKSARSKKTETDNEKFTFRVFLVRLGMINDEYKFARKVLLENLEGNSAFRSGAKPEKIADTE